jgi:hypothetical protein
MGTMRSPIASSQVAKHLAAAAVYRFRVDNPSTVVLSPDIQDAFLQNCFTGWIRNDGHPGVPPDSSSDEDSSTGTPPSLISAASTTVRAWKP